MRREGIQKRRASMPKNHERQDYYRYEVGRGDWGGGRVKMKRWSVRM